MNQQSSKLQAKDPNHGGYFYCHLLCHLFGVCNAGLHSHIPFGNDVLKKNTMEFLSGIGVIKSFGLKDRNGGILRSIQNSTKENLNLEYAIVPFTMFQELILYVFDIAIIALAVRFCFSGMMVLTD